MNKYKLLNKIFPYGNLWMYPLFLLFAIAMMFLFWITPTLCMATWIAIIMAKGIEFSDPHNMAPVINSLSLFNWQAVGVVSGVYFFSSLIIDIYLYLKAFSLFHQPLYKEN